MQRRSFLGSVLGLVGGIPFLAQKPVINKPWSMGFRVVETDEWLLAPSIEAVEEVGREITIRCEEIAVTQIMKVDRIALINPNGRRELEAPLTYSPCLCNGDTFKFKLTFIQTGSFEILFFKEFLDDFKSRNKRGKI